MLFAIIPNFTRKEKKRKEKAISRNIGVDNKNYLEENFYVLVL